MAARHSAAGAPTGCSHASSVPVVYTSIVRTAMSGSPKSACSISPCSVTRSVPSMEPGGWALMAM